MTSILLVTAAMHPAWHVTRQVEGHAGQMPASHVRLEAWLPAFKAFFNSLPATGKSQCCSGIGSGKVEGGVIFLPGLKLPGNFDFGINNGVSISANDDGGYHADIINSVSVSHEIAGPLSGYAEFYSSVPTQHSGDWVGTVDMGLLLMIGKNCRMDAGLNIGVTHGADDLQPIVGVSYRF